MRNTDNFFLCAASFVLLVLAAFSVMACGRRGDPVPISPAAVMIVEEDAGPAEGPETDLPDTSGKEGPGGPEEEKSLSDIPARVIAVYTQNSVVLTWDEIVGRDVKLYRVYRSEGEGYSLIGESATPAFTDKNIEKKREYMYKITAVGIYESPASAEIKISTEMR